MIDKDALVKTMMRTPTWTNVNPQAVLVAETAYMIADRMINQNNNFVKWRKDQKSRGLFDGVVGSFLEITAGAVANAVDAIWTFESEYHKGSLGDDGLLDKNDSVPGKDTLMPWDYDRIKQHIDAVLEFEIDGADLDKAILAVFSARKEHKDFTINTDKMLMNNDALLVCANQLLFRTSIALSRLPNKRNVPSGVLSKFDAMDTFFDMVLVERDSDTSSGDDASIDSMDRTTDDTPVKTSGFGKKHRATPELQDVVYLETLDYAKAAPAFAAARSWFLFLKGTNGGKEAVADTVEANKKRQQEAAERQKKSNESSRGNAVLNAASSKAA